MIFLTLPMPPSVNHAYARGHNGRVYLTPEAQSFKALAWAATFGVAHVEPPVRVYIRMVVVNQRKRDIDNICKLCLDSVKFLGFDDNDIVDLHIHNDLDRGGIPRLEVKIWGAGEKEESCS